MANLSDETLLERIRRMERTPGARGPRDVSLGLESIMGHLRKMLNTRQGSVPIALDYGMPDLTNFPGENLVNAGEEMQHIIETVIQKYEPRLGNLEVRFDAKSGEASLLRFRLEGTMKTDRQGTLPIVLETVVSAEGRVKVEK